MGTMGYGMIGLGTVAERHWQCVARLPGARIAAVADRQFQLAQELSARHPDRPRPYADYRELLADASVDVVVICLPTHLHAEATVAAAAAGKHIYCEKAMASTLRDCQRMNEACATAGVKLTIGQSTRFRPVHQHMRRLIESDAIGEIVACEFRCTSIVCTEATVPIRYRWRYVKGARGHGVVVNQACHAVDTLRFMIGQDPERVSAYIGNRYSGHVEPEDQYTIQAVCGGGAMMTLSQYSTPEHTPTLNNGYFIFGSKGVLSHRLEQESVITLEQFGKKPQEIAIAKDLREEDAFMRLHRLFYASLQNDTPVPVSGEDAMCNIHFTLGAYVANDQRQWVALPLDEKWYDFHGPERKETIPGQV